MRWQVLGWPLLCVSFFMPSPIQEQCIAGQTLLCGLLADQPQSFHVATIVVVISYFTQHGLHDSMAALILHHVIVALAIAIQYTRTRWAPFMWTALCWSARWLGTMLLFGPREHPLRGCVKCLLFFCVVYSRQSWGVPYTILDAFKWCWILIVHEIAWTCIPVQMLYEVYTHRAETRHT